MCTNLLTSVYSRNLAEERAATQEEDLSCLNYKYQHLFNFFLNKFLSFFLIFWPCRVLVAGRGLSLVAASGGYSSCGAWVSHCGGFSCCEAWALGVRAQQLWHAGLVVPRHVGSFCTRARTCVPYVGRQILNHCATREIRLHLFSKSPAALCFPGRGSQWDCQRKQLGPPCTPETGWPGHVGCWPP